MSFDWFGRSPTPIFRQSNNAECGLACLGMVASHHGYDSDMTSLRRQFRVTSRGVTLAGIVDMADQIGLSATPLQCEPDDLPDLHLPAILHWDMSHFVVLTAVRRGRFIIHDPALGVLHADAEEMDAHFTGVALEFEKAADFTPRRDRSQLRFSDIVRFNMLSGKSLLQVTALTIFLQLFVLASPLFIQLVIDEAVLKSDMQILLAVASAFALFKLFELTSTFFRGIVAKLIAETLSFTLRTSVFHHISRLPMSFFRDRSVGDIQQRFMSLGVLSRFLVDGFIEAVIDGLFALSIAAVLFFYDPLLAMTVITFVIIYAVLRFMFLEFAHRKEVELEVAAAEEAGKFLETLSTMQAVKVAGVEVRRETHWRGLATKATNANLKVGALDVSFDLLSKAIPSVSYIVVVVLAARAAILGDMTIGMVTAFLAYMTIFQDGMIRFLDKLAEFRLLNVHLERLADIVMAAEETDLNDTGSEETFEGRIDLRGVSFRYGDREPLVLDNVDLTIEPGEFVAIAGPSGEGKTTLLQLILGLEEPTEGTILFDGKPITAWGKRCLRRQMGVVMQDDRLLAGSIAENISLFDQAPDPDRLLHAAEVAAIDDEIKDMPMGFATPIGELGTGLSGGQAQRITIARAVYRKPKLLILDEGTSNLDIETEEKVNRALRALNTTRIAVAHRPDTLSKAERIIYVAEGKISASQPDWMRAAASVSSIQECESRVSR